MSFQDQAAVFARLAPFHHQWSEAMATPFNFYVDFNRQFYEILWHAPNLGEADAKFKKGLSELFFQKTTVEKIAEKIEKLLELKFELKKLLDAEPDSLTIGSSLTKVVERFIMLCQLHLELSKYQKSGLSFPQLISIVLKINDIHLRWERYSAKFDALQRINQKANGLISDDSASLKLDLTLAKGVEPAAATIADFCRLLTDCADLFESLYGPPVEKLKITFIELAATNPSRLSSLVVLPISWQLPFSSFLATIINDYHAKQNAKSEPTAKNSSIVKLVGDILFFHRQSLKAAKKGLLKQQKIINQTLSLLPANSFIKISALDKIEAQALPKNIAKESVILPKPHHDKPEVKEEGITATPDLTTKNTAGASAEVADTKKATSDKEKKPDATKSSTLSRANKEHVGFLTGG